MAKPVLQIIVGSTRPGRVGKPVAGWNAIDSLNHEWADKPAGFVSYGGIAAGTRAVEMLIQVVSVLGMIPMPIQVNIPLIAERMTADHRFTANEVLDDSAVALLDQLARWTGRLGSTR